MHLEAMCPFVAVCEFKLQLPSGNVQIRAKSPVSHTKCDVIASIGLRYHDGRKCSSATSQTISN